MAEKLFRETIVQPSDRIIVALDDMSPGYAAGEIARELEEAS